MAISCWRKLVSLIVLIMASNSDFWVSSICHAGCCTGGVNTVGLDTAGVVAVVPDDAGE
jgi:hypothetical protein